MRILTWIVWVVTLIFAIVNFIVLLISNKQDKKIECLINTVLYFLITYILASQVLFIS